MPIHDLKGIVRMAIGNDKFQCANCKKIRKSSERSNLDGVITTLLFFTLSKVLPTFHKSKEICKSCTWQVYVWFIFVVLIVIASPFLDELRGR
jgi:hypothetical protein